MEKEQQGGCHICVDCGYVYDPVQGDPMNSISQGTPFNELPGEWVCPMCYGPCDQFDPLG